MIFAEKSEYSKTDKLLPYTWWVIIYYIWKIFFSADKTFYSPCPSLEGTKDALCKRSRLVRTGRAACTNIVVMEMHFARATRRKALYVRKRGNQSSHKARGSVTVIPVSRVQLYRGSRGTRTSPSISIFQSCLQLPCAICQHLEVWPARQVRAYRTR